MYELVDLLFRSFARVRRLSIHVRLVIYLWKEIHIVLRS